MSFPIMSLLASFSDEELAYTDGNFVVCLTRNSYYKLVRKLNTHDIDPMVVSYDNPIKRDEPTNNIRSYIIPLFVSSPTTRELYDILYCLIPEDEYLGDMGMLLSDATLAGMDRVMAMASANSRYIGPSPQAWKAATTAYNEQHRANISALWSPFGDTPTLDRANGQQAMRQMGITSDSAEAAKFDPRQYCVNRLVATSEPETARRKRLPHR